MVKLVIDSAADISAEMAKAMGVNMLPMTISFGNEEFLDGVNLLPNQFYEKLVCNNELPKTSQINTYRWEEEFKKHVDNGDEVVAITLSSKLSATYNSACQAAENFNGKVFVVDSLSATAGERILIEYALALVKEGKFAKEIFDILEEKKKKVQIRAMIDTLKYLKKGGRISAVAAFAGELMGLKPMVAVIDGRVEVVGKCLGIKRAIPFMNKDIQILGGIDFDMPMYVLYTGNDESKVDKYIQDNAEMWECGAENVRKNCMGGTIGTHVGPGAIGVAFFSK